MKNKLFLLFLLAVVNLYLSADSVSIIYDTPGKFVYANGYTNSPTDINDSSFIITSSNISIDFGGGIFSQEGLTPGFAGITIAPNVSNVTLKNGTIAGFTGTGIIVSEGCSNIFFDSMTISFCTDAGIYLNGGDLGIKDISIKNCIFSNMMQGAASIVSGIHAVNTARLRIKDCYFEGNELALSTSATGIHLENSSVFELLTNRSVNQRGSQFAAGYSFQNCSEGLLKECLSYGCTTSSNGGGDSVFGFYMTRCQRAWLKDCQSVATTAGSGQSTGFYSADGTRNIIECVLVQSEQASLDASGIILANEVGSYINDSVIRGIQSDNIAYGIQLKGTCTYCHIEHNLISNNNGTNGAFGIIDFANPSTSLIAKNDCFNSGTSYSVTYSNFSLPVISGSLTSGIPSVACGTFDNISVTP